MVPNTPHSLSQNVADETDTPNPSTEALEDAPLAEVATDGVACPAEAPWEEPTEAAAEEEDEEESAEEGPESTLQAQRLPLSSEASLVLKAQIEALLFLTAKPMPLEALAEQLQASVLDTEEALVELIQDYAFRPDTALEIDDAPEGYLLQVRAEYQNLVHQMLPMELSGGALRTLSVLAIKAPLLQSELIAMRGSSAYEQLQELLALGLVHKKRAGRSYQLTLSQRFYEHFKLTEDKKVLARVLPHLL
jgi:segregation and condensation protein B